MSESKKNNKEITDTILTTAILPIVIGLVTKVADKLEDKVTDNLLVDNISNDDRVIIPELYRKGFPLDLDQAVKLLEGCGLKTATCKMEMKDANIKYKDCFDFQVLTSNPKQGISVKSGSIVYLKYITADVISESQRLFVEGERVKAEIKEKKATERLERKARAKENIVSAVNMAKHEVKKVFNHDVKKN